MKTFKPFVVTFSDYGPKFGTCWNEALDGQSLEDVIELIASGEMEDVVSVLSIEPGKPPEDLTEEVVKRLLTMIKEDPYSVATSVAEFFERNGHYLDE